MIGHMTASDNASHLPVAAGDRVAIVINNLGGTSYLELSIVARDAVAYLGKEKSSV